MVILKYDLRTLDINGYKILNKISNDAPTRVTGHSNTIIDHFFTDIYRYEYNLSLIDDSISDHHYAILAFKTDIRMPIQRRISKYINYENISVQLESQINANTNFTSMYSKINSIVNDNTQITSHPINNKKRYRKPYLTSTLLSLINIKDRMYKLMKTYPEDAELKTNFRSFKNQLTNKLRAAKNTFYNNKIINEVNDPKKLWQTINTLIYNKQHNTVQEVFPSQMIINNETVVDAQTILNHILIGLSQIFASG